MEPTHVGDWMALATLVMALATLIATIVAVWIAKVTLGKSNKNASIATVLTLNESFRQAWRRFIDEEDPSKREYEFSDLMNLFEIACGIEYEKSFTGVSRQLIREYLKETIGLLKKDEYANEKIPQMLRDDLTFCYIRKFINSKPRLSVIIPPAWYETTSQN